VILSRGNRLRLDMGVEDVDGSTDPGRPADGDTGFLTESDFREFEKKNLIAVLQHADWRVSGAGGAADLLGIKPSTFSYRMKTFGISAKPPPDP